MINNGAVSRGQFGQVETAAIAETTANNVYISQTPVKQETRETFEKDEKLNRPNQTQNPKKRKHKEQREQHVLMPMNNKIRCMKKLFNCHVRNSVKSNVTKTPAKTSSTKELQTSNSKRCWTWK